MTLSGKAFFTILITFYSINSSFSQGFNSVFSTDGSTVIAVGNNGNLFRSINGGITYGSDNLSSTHLNSIYGIGSKWIIAGNSGSIYISTDGGNNFSLTTIGGNNFYSVYFADANTGWVGGYNGTIYRTTNGGANWSLQSTPTSQNILSIKFKNVSSGAASCDGGAILLYNGSSWQQLTSPTAFPLLSVDIKQNTIIATGSEGFIIKSTNLGINWTTIDYKILTKSEVRGVSMIDTNTFYTCGGGGFIRKSTDGGNTFSYQPNPMMANLVNIFFYNSLSGWAVSSLNNAILRTTDGGTSWNFQQGVSVSYSWSQKQAHTGNIGNGFCLHPKNKNGIFIMMGSDLYRSLDKGETWTQIGTCSIGGTAHTFFVNAVDTNIMLCSKGTSGGYICKSTNYGLNWFSVLGPINLTSYGMPLETDPNNPNTVYLGPDNQAMRKSTDYGNTWTVLSGGEPGGTFRSPCDITIQFENPGFIFVGDGTTGSGSGKFWKSTNDGMNWTLINTVSGSEIPMISNSSIDLNLIYHTTWSSGGFWKSTNMGSAFLQLSGPSTNLWATDIAKDDPTAVAYGAYSTAVYHSTNSGNTFTTTNTPSSPEAGMLFYDKSTLISQKGGGVYKLNISYQVLTPLTNISSIVPADFSLMQNYPNPFNPVTKIKFDIRPPLHPLLSKEGKSRFIGTEVVLIIYNTLGQKVATLINEELKPGTYEVEFDGTNYPSGVYFYQLTTENYTETKKFILIK
jgi:photosystem II stability/assembly factor-like uncharacterized protein